MGILIDLDSLWERQQRTHTCKADDSCAGCKKNICELCSVHTCPGGKWESRCKACQDKKEANAKPLRN